MAKQWAYWSLKPGHIRNSFGVDVKKHFYREFSSPILVLSIDRDSTANQANIEGLFDLYRSAAFDCKKIVPADYGFKKVEHFNFFKPKYEKLWPIIVDWLKAPERQTIKTMALKMSSPSVTVVAPGHAKGIASVRLSEQQTAFIHKHNKQGKEVKAY